MKNEAVQRVMVTTSQKKYQSKIHYRLFLDEDAALKKIVH